MSRQSSKVRWVGVGLWSAGAVVAIVLCAVGYPDGESRLMWLGLATFSVVVAFVNLVLARVEGGWPRR